MSEPSVAGTTGTFDAQATFGVAVDALLGALPEAQAETVMRGAVPHWLDGRALATLMGPEGAPAEAEALFGRLRFVARDGAGRLRFREEARQHLRVRYREGHPDDWIAANRTMLDHMRGRAASAEPSAAPEYDIEALYHLLIVDEDDGLQVLADRFEDACWHHQLGLAERYLGQAQELRGEMTAAGGEWVDYYLARLQQSYQVGDSGAATFRRVADGAESATLRAAAAWSLGVSLTNEQQWSEAMRWHRRSLADAGDGPPAGRAMLALGNAFRDLANRSGGFQPEDEPDFGYINHWLSVLQQLPFLAYQALVRRWSWVPNAWWWHVGTDYQDWIVAFLLQRARRWYQRAADAFGDADARGAADARLALADLDHQLGRWSRARRAYREMLETEVIQDSPYRQARAELGLGAALLDSGELEAAVPALSRANAVFRRFQDRASAGLTAAHLGTAYARQGRPDDAAAARLESAQAFGLVGDQLARTGMVARLEHMAGSPDLSEPLREQIAAAVGQVTERHYITRFPETLLRQFRNLALYVALPPTFVLTFLIGMTLVPLMWVLEGETLLLARGAAAGTSLVDYLILAAFGILPLLASLWLFRFIYGLAGMLFVRYLGRDPVRFEREQPSILVADSSGVTRHRWGPEPAVRLDWAAITRCAGIDFSLIRRPIHLLSRTALTAGEGDQLVVDGITAGYTDLGEQLERGLAGSSTDHPPKVRGLGFALLEPRWVLVVLAVAIAFTALAFASGAMPVFSTESTAAVQSGSPTDDGPATVNLPLTTAAAVLVPSLLLLFTVVSHWRLLWHDVTVRRATGLGESAMPRWFLWLSVLVWTAITIGWLLLFAPSP